MPNFRSLSELKKAPPQVVLASLKNTDTQAANTAASEMLRMAQSYGLDIRQYLDAAIEVPSDMAKLGVTSGYEAALVFLNLPVKNDYTNQVSLQAAADTFATQPATRLLFPEVVSDMMKWKQGELDLFVQVAPMIAQTRTVSGSNELIYMELDENNQDLSMNAVAEGGNIPIVSITHSQKSVKFWKVGKGYRFTYEFSRRASIDILTPFVNRMTRQFEIDKVNHAVAVLVNGDGVASAITVDAETAYGGTNGALDYKSLLKWLVARMAAGYSIDTLIMNYATYGEFLTLFEPVAGGGNKFLDTARAAGITMGTTSLMDALRLNLAIGPNVGASIFVGINKAETLEELVEAGSDIVENERVIRSQHVQYFRSINVGYNLVGPNNRRGFSFAS